MILAETTPGSVRISSSARLIGRTLPAMLFNFELCGILMRRETGGQYCRRLSVYQAKNPSGAPPRKLLLQSTIQRFAESAMPDSYQRDADFYQRRWYPRLWSDRQRDVRLRAAVNPLRRL